MDSSSPTFERVRPTIDYAERYKELLSEAKGYAAELNIPSEWYVATMGILAEMGEQKPHLPWLGCESLQGLPKALEVASIIESFWGTPVNKAAVWCAFLGHDNGKIDLPDEVNIASHEGAIWPEEYRKITEVHVVTGSQRAERYGLPLIVTRPIAESHGKQLTPTYGVNPVLSPEELHVRNAIAIADSLDAMFDRENTLNNGMSYEDRIAYCEAYIRNACSDYQNGGQILAEIIIHRVVPRPQLEVAA